MISQERKPGRVVVLVLTGHALAAAWTWRDIRQQPAQQVRGNKTFWRISSAVNTLGSASYWLTGRRYRKPQPRYAQTASAMAVMSLTCYRRAEHPVRRGNQPWNAYHRKQAYRVLFAGGVKWLAGISSMRPGVARPGADGLGPADLVRDLR
jgi:hypothetical protein